MSGQVRTGYGPNWVTKQPLSFVGGVKSGQALIRQRRTAEEQVPTFRSDMTAPEIAAMLVLSPGTVKTHFRHIYEKLGVRDRAAAVADALRSGVIA